MQVYVLEARRKGDPEEVYEILGVFTMESRAYEAADLIWEKGEWCDFVYSCHNLDDASKYL